jgi:hypothetical protein
MVNGAVREWPASKFSTVGVELYWRPLRPLTSSSQHDAFVRGMWISAVAVTTKSPGSDGMNVATTDVVLAAIATPLVS